MTELVDVLRQRGHRITRARRAVLTALVDGPAHPTAETVLQVGRLNHSRLSRASVYRTLRLLESLALVRGLPSSQGRFYVLVSPGHHHLVCRSCGRVREFAGCGLCEGWLPAAKESNFRVGGHVLEVFGLCEGCQQKA